MKIFFLDKNWIEEKFRKVLENFFEGCEIKKIKIASRKPGLSAIKKGEKFFKYKVTIVERGEKKEREIFIKKTETVENEILNKLQHLKLPLPKPIFYHSKEKILFYLKLEGIPLSEIIKEEKLNEKILRKVVVSLKIFHQAKVGKLRAYSSSALRKKAEGILLAFKRHHPICEKKVRELFKKILPLKRKFLSLVKKTLTHGDFTPTNIILTPEKEIGIIDFNYTRLDDSLKDVGMFLAQLNSCKFRFGLSPQKVLEWQEFFKQEYVNQKKNLIPRINLYQAWEEIHNASIFIKGFKQDKEFAEEMLKEAERLISLKV